VQLATGHVADAVKTLLPALDDEYAGRFEENSARADALLSLAEAQRLAGDLGPAEDALDACRRLCHERELAAIATRAIQEEAALLAAHGRYREAYERHRAFHAETMARYSAERDSRARALQVVYETYEARRDHRRAHELSLRDPLTQLYNRRHVDDELPALLRHAAADGTPLSVALVDIDHFKLINDRHSHEVGTSSCRRSPASSPGPAPRTARRASAPGWAARSSCSCCRARTSRPRTAAPSGCGSRSAATTGGACATVWR
jgi:hypothetical protein